MFYAVTQYSMALCKCIQANRAFLDFSGGELLWLVACFLFAQHLYFSSSDSPLPVTSRVCFVKFHESESVGVSQHLTNTVFVDRALIVVPFAEGECLEQSQNVLCRSVT